MTFHPANGSVWLQGPKPVRLTDNIVEGLLDIFEREGAVSSFHDLYEAHLKAGGIARVSSFRRAV